MGSSSSQTESAKPQKVLSCLAAANGIAALRQQRARPRDRRIGRETKHTPPLQGAFQNASAHLGRDGSTLGPRKGVQNVQFRRSDLLPNSTTRACGKRLAIFAECLRVLRLTRDNEGLWLGRYSPPKIVGACNLTEIDTYGAWLLLKSNRQLENPNVSNVCSVFNCLDTLVEPRGDEGSYRQTPFYSHLACCSNALCNSHCVTGTPR